MKTFAFLRETPFNANELTWRGGKYNGYVGFFDKLEPSYMIDDGDDLLDDYISVHGGITFDGKLSRKDAIIPITEIPENWYKARIIGFDTCHYNDTPEEWDYEHVVMETLDLQRQIEDAIDRSKII